MGDTTSFASTALKSSGPSISLLDTSKHQTGNVGVGTYKGVMLCNRPFGGTDAAAVKGGDGPKPFSVNKVSEIVGLSNLAIRDKVKRPRKETALTRHRKWLAELQKQKDRLETQFTLEILKKEEEKEKFAKQEAELRKIATGILRSDSKSQNQDEEEKKLHDAKAQAYDIKLSEPADPKELKINVPIPPLNLPMVAEKKGDKPTVSKAHKPAWAMTETAAENAIESREQEDEDDLLEFAKGLDFDRYLDDMEVSAMMERVKRY